MDRSLIISINTEIILPNLGKNDASYDLRFGGRKNGEEESVPIPTRSNKELDAIARCLARGTNFLSTDQPPTTPSS